MDVDLATSFCGISSEPFPQKTIDVLSQPVDTKDIEMKPDGLIYLPEIKYRRILNRNLVIFHTPLHPQLRIDIMSFDRSRIFVSFKR